MSIISQQDLQQHHCVPLWYNKVEDKGEKRLTVGARSTASHGGTRPSDTTSDSTICTLIFSTLWEANISAFMAIRGIMNKMAEGNEYSDQSLKCEMKL